MPSTIMTEMSRYRANTEERLTWSVGAVVVSKKKKDLRRHTYADDEVRCTLLIDSIRTCRRPIMDANASDKSIIGLDSSIVGHSPASSTARVTSAFSGLVITYTCQFSSTVFLLSKSDNGRIKPSELVTYLSLTVPARIIL